MRQVRVIVTNPQTGPFTLPLLQAPSHWTDDEVRDVIQNAWEVFCRGEPDTDGAFIEHLIKRHPFSQTCEPPTLEVTVQGH